MAVDVDTAGEVITDGDEHNSTDDGGSTDRDFAPTDDPDTRAEHAEAVVNKADARPRHGRQLVVAGLLMVVVLAGLVGWLGYRSYVVQQQQQRHELFLETARQGALNLTTVSHTSVDADVQRILDSATGTFFEDFQQRSTPFADVVRQAQSTSVGNVTAAGIETENSYAAQVLVAVTVNTSSPAGADQQPRSWRMRIAVEYVDESSAKISNVEFVA